MRAILDAVGDILREEGFWALHITAVARRIGKDKSLIRYYFGGMSGLLKAYIAEKDYWQPFFERYTPTEPMPAPALQQLFVDLMRENFRQFCADHEMQKVILWQASAHHPVMLAASANREQQGGRLIQLAQQWFAGTDIDFGAVLAVVLGGSYLPPLQCNAGNGAFCGKEIANPRDREIIERTIGQIISWAWDAAAKQKQPQTTNDMHTLNYEYEKIESLLNNRTNTPPASQTADPVLRAEAKRLETLLLAELLRLDNEVQIRMFLKAHLHRLVALCNRLYDPKAAANPDAEVLLTVMDALRRAVSDLLPEEVVVPEIFRDRILADYRTRWKVMRLRLAGAGIDDHLLDIMGLPLERFADADTTPTWMLFRYLRKYVQGLDAFTAEEAVDDWLATERLIALGFNHARFISYLSRSIRANTSTLDPTKQHAYLNSLRQRVTQVHRRTLLRLDRDMPPVAEELVRWLDAELASLGALHVRQPNPMKMNTTFKVTQLAIWKKLLYDHGICDEANLDILSEKIAHNYTTKGQESLSPASIKSKFYTKDPADIAMLRKLLDDLRDDLSDFE